MNLQEARATMIEWLKNVKHWYLPDHSWEDYFFTDDEWTDYRFPDGHPTKGNGDPNRFHVHLFTNDNEFHISATIGKKSYLGCIATARKKRPGENWTRGSDLPDGSFSKKTFDHCCSRFLQVHSNLLIKGSVNRFSVDCFILLCSLQTSGQPT